MTHRNTDQARRGDLEVPIGGSFRSFAMCVSSRSFIDTRGLHLRHHWKNASRISSLGSWMLIRIGLGVSAMRRQYHAIIGLTKRSIDGMMATWIV